LRALTWTLPALLLVSFDRWAQQALRGWRERVAGMGEGADGMFLSWPRQAAGFAVRLALILAHLTSCE
jgi:hypothetical protein